MLGLYLIIGHKSCNMLSILNKLTLQKKSQNVKTNYVFLNKKVKAQQQNKKSNVKILAEAGNWTQNLSHPKQMCYGCTTKSTGINNCSPAI